MTGSIPIRQAHLQSNFSLRHLLRAFFVKINDAAEALNRFQEFMVLIDALIRYDANLESLKVAPIVLIPLSDAVQVPHKLLRKPAAQTIVHHPYRKHQNNRTQRSKAKSTYLLPSFQRQHSFFFVISLSLRFPLSLPLIELLHLQLKLLLHLYLRLQLTWLSVLLQYLSCLVVVLKHVTLFERIVFDSLSYAFLKLNDIVIQVFFICFLLDGVVTGRGVLLCFKVVSQTFEILHFCYINFEFN
jgi:hypothetical protein